MELRKFLVILFMIFTMLPCVAVDESFMGKAIASWYGYSLDSFIKQWGYPDRQSVLAGHNLYYWDIVKSVHTNYSSNYSNTYENYCTVIIETSDENIVKNGQYKGNACPYSYLLNGEKFVNSENDPWKIEKLLKQQKRKNAKLNK